MVPEGSDAPPGRVLQELEVVERAAAAGEAGEGAGPAGLLLVAVRELDVGVVQGEVVGVGELLEAWEWLGVRCSAGS